MADRQTDLPDTFRADAFRALAEKRGWLHPTGRLQGDWNTRAIARDLGLAPSTVHRILADQAGLSYEFVAAVLTVAEQTYGQPQPLTGYFVTPERSSNHGT